MGGGLGYPSVPNVAPICILKVVGVPVGGAVELALCLNEEVAAVMMVLRFVAVTDPVRESP